MTRDKIQLFADSIITPLMLIIDEAIKNYSDEELNESLSNMTNHTSNLRAWPFQEMQEKADQREAENVVFKKVINLINARRKQKSIMFDLANKNASMHDLYKQFGIDN